MRRTISIVVAVVLAIGVVATIVVSADRSEKRATVVRGVVDAESRAFFDDARVKNALERHHYDVKFDTVDDRAMTSTLDLSRYDFAFTSGTPVAEKISAERGVAQSYVPFVSPMAFATFGDIATILENAGVARRHGAYWTLDVKAYLDLVKRSTRWNDLRANTTYPAAKFVLVRTTDIATSNAAAMYASIMSYVANGNHVLASPVEVDGVVNMISPLFVKQGHAERSSEAPFDDYLSIGRSAAPIVNVYEAQFVARAAATDASVRPNMVLMYPNPDLLSKHTLVPLTANGDAIGRLLTDDPTLQELAVENGFRVASNPDAFNRFVQQHHVDVDPNLSEVIVPPTYDNLDSLVTKIDAALHAALGPAPAPPATTASLTVPTERGSGNP